MQSVYPDSARAAVKEHKKEEAQKALDVIGKMGDQLNAADGEALFKIVKEAQQLETEKEDTEREINIEVKKLADEAAPKEKVQVALARQ